MKLSPLGKSLVILSVIMVLIGEMLALYYWGHGSWEERISFVLQIVALYGIGLSFLLRIEVLREARFRMDDVTSANLFVFIAGNFRFLSIFLSIASLGMQSKKTKLSALGFGGGCLFFILTPVIFLYPIFHIFIVMPVTYVCYVVASSLVSGAKGTM